MRITFFILMFAGIVSGQEILLQSGRQQMAFSATNGAIVRAGDFRSGEFGLWQLRFRDGATLCATNASQFTCERDAANNALRLNYRAPEATVIVTVTGRETGFEFRAEVTPVTNTVLELAVPARLRFEPAQVKRFITPVHPHLGVGAAFNRKLFEPQPPDCPSSWKPQTAGPNGYRQLFGGGVRMHDLHAAPVPLTVTDDGRKWFGAELSKRLVAAVAGVHRPSLSNQVDVVLLDSAPGPFFTGSHLGGAGTLWRFGGTVDETFRRPALEVVGAVLHKLASVPRARHKLGLVSLLNGPAQGAFCDVSVRDWRERFARVAASVQVELVELASAEQMIAAANDDEFLAILNPYGEQLPVPAQSSLPATVAAIGRYVRRGGNWFEVGGYPFHAALQPERFLKYESSYPPVFADFFHLDSVAGGASIYRIQPRHWPPWAGTNNQQAIFVPGRLAFGGDAQGGWCERAFGTFVPAGQTWTTPVVRVVFGGNAEDDLRAYCQANGITRTLREKLAPELFEKFRRAVLLRWSGSASEKLAALDKIPVPALLHDADYLHGGFDKQYPDHLPPSPTYGTPAELRALHDRAHALGHLVMPYTNPTWWCDHPRGPTFVAAGEAPLARGLDDKPLYERYAHNDGWTICLWHPAVQAANRRTRQQFTDEYPVDLLFEDQCGARRWLFDLNPASPTPFAYAEGLLSLVDEDCAAVPLGTEDGWDRVVNAESQLCGFTAALGPGHRAAHAPEMKTVYHPRTWELYPFVQRIAHDKAALLHHDLGKFVMDQPTLSWTLGLGFAMSYRAQARALGEPGPREWLRWLDRIQKSICARYVGEPVGLFEHEQGSTASGDDGFIRAVYGPVEILANLSPSSRCGLPAYGFRATAPGLIANGCEELSFIAEGADLWIYAQAGRECAVQLPVALSGRVTVAFDGQPAQQIAGQSGALQVQLPSGNQLPQLWHAIVTR